MIRLMKLIGVSYQLMVVDLKFSDCSREGYLPDMCLIQAQVNKQAGPLSDKRPAYCLLPVVQELAAELNALLAATVWLRPESLA